MSKCIDCGAQLPAGMKGVRCIPDCVPIKIDDEHIRRTAASVVRVSPADAERAAVVRSLRAFCTAMMERHGDIYLPLKWQIDAIERGEHLKDTTR